MKKIILIALVSTFLWKCTFNNIGCNEGKLETIFFDFDNKNKTFDHYVLLKGCTRERMDSSNIINLVLDYATNLKKGKPLEIIRIYNSVDGFIENEISQPMSDINKNCLVLINFDKNFKPIEFIFYNKKGQWKYKGSLWRPNG
jgi:hypothetical protein